MNATRIPIRKIIFFVSFILCQLMVLAQAPASGIIIGGNIGTSKVLTEITPDFHSINEFEHHPGMLFEPEIGKLFGNHFEAGTSFTVSSFSGKNDDTQFSATGYHAAMKDLLDEPVKYNTSLMGQKFYFGYYFRSFSKIDKPYMVEPFVRLGGGYFYYTSEFSYQDPELGTIFGKGVQGYTDLTTGILFTTAGIKMYLNPSLFINSSVSLNYVHYDFLDAVHNYTPDGYRDSSTPDVRGLYTDIKIGIFYQINRKGTKSGRAGTGPGVYLPFSK